MSTTTSTMRQVPGRNRVPRVAAATLAAVVMLVLSACGVRIDTTLNLDASGAGSRVMSLTLSENLDAVRGGAAAADASIRRHLPAGIEFSGMTTGADGAMVATFTVNFADPQEYKTKMAALLAASDQQWSEENVFVVQQTDFVQGAEVNESFSSRESLEWMFAGLLADGVVDASNASNMSEAGTTTVNFNGISYEASSPIEFSEVVDHGFTSVAINTTPLDAGFSRTLTYWVEDKADYTAQQAVFDGYFATLGDAGMEVAQDAASAGITWTATFTADSAEQVVERTNAALASQETVFTMVTEPSADDAATLQMTIAEYAECSAICSPSAGPVLSEIDVSDGYVYLGEGGSFEANVFARDLTAGASPAVFELVVPFETVSARLAIGVRGAVTWTGQFSLASTQAELVGDAMRTILENDGAADVAVGTADEMTTYTVEVSGADPAKFASAFTAWSGSTTGGYSVYDLEDANLVSEHYEIAAVLPLGELLGRHIEGVPVAYEVSVPFGQSVETDYAMAPEGLTADGTTATFTTGSDAMFSLRAGGTSIVGFVLFAGLALVLLTAVLVVVLHRRRLMEAVARRRSTKAVQVTAAREQTTVGAAGHDAVTSRYSVPTARPAPEATPKSTDVPASTAAPAAGGEADYL